MTGEESRKQIDALFDETEGALGTRFTRRADRPAPLLCDRPDGSKGTGFGMALRTAPPPPDIPAAMATVQRLWQERGYRVETRGLAQGGLQDVVGTDPNGTVIIFGTGPASRSMTLHGVTAFGFDPTRQPTSRPA